MPELFVFTHPHAVINEECRHGRCDGEIGLSKTGKKQAEQIAEFLKQRDLEGIWASPLPRTMQLALKITEINPTEISIFCEENLAEMSLGNIDGLAEPEIMQICKKSWQHWTRKKIIPDIPAFIGGETPEQVANRGEQIFRKIARLYLTPRPRVIISHPVLLGFTFARLQGKSLTRALDISLQPGSLTLLRWSQDRFTFILKNSATHLISKAPVVSR